MKRTPTITRKEKDYFAWYRHTNLRSQKAKDVDSGSDKNITNNFAEYVWDDSRSDWPGVDTVLRQMPSGYTKTKGKKAYDEVTNVLGRGKYY